MGLKDCEEELEVNRTNRPLLPQVARHALAAARREFRKKAIPAPYATRATRASEGRKRLVARGDGVAVAHLVERAPGAERPDGHRGNSKPLLHLGERLAGCCPDRRRPDSTGWILEGRRDQPFYGRKMPPIDFRTIELHTFEPSPQP